MEETVSGCSNFRQRPTDTGARPSLDELSGRRPTDILILRGLFAAVLLLRLLYPLFDSPLDHLFSDPARHWDNGLRFFRPSIMGSDDPYLYQLWLHVVQRVAGTSRAVVSLGCGLLCAAMPYGWYRAVREVLPARAALVGGVVIAIMPDFLSIYAYFMNETLLLSVSGFAFWLTLRADRKRTVYAFTAACSLWVVAAFTRTAALPLAVLNLLWIGFNSSDRLLKLLICLGLFASVAIPAGLHGRAKLGYFAPFGNLYLHNVYRASGARRIELEFGPDGHYWFVSPSFVNPTLYPFSDWLTSRRGTVSLRIDLRQGRRDWEQAAASVEQIQNLPKVTDTWENVAYLVFGPSWPNSDARTLPGWLTLWMRWLWAPTIVFVAYSLAKGTYRGREKVFATCGLLVFLWLGLQRSGIVEGRFRLPLEPILLAAALIAAHRVTRPRTPQV